MAKDVDIYYETAKQYGLPTHFLHTISCLKITLGKKNYVFLPFFAPFNQFANIYITKNRFMMNEALKNNGFPVPKAVGFHRKIFQENPLRSLIQDLQSPFVVKPMINTFVGADVISNIKDLRHLNDCLRACFQEHSFMQVEEFQQGLREYHVLLFKKKIIGVVERFAASGLVHSFGTMMHRDNAKQLSRAANALGLEFAGFNILCEDIQKSFNQTKWIILEANTGSDINLHECPDSGKKMLVSRKLIRSLIGRHPLSYIYHRFIKWNKDG